MYRVEVTLQFNVLKRKSTANDRKNEELYILIMRTEKKQHRRTNFSIGRDRYLRWELITTNINRKLVGCPGFVKLLLSST